MTADRGGSKLPASNGNRRSIRVSIVAQIRPTQGTLLSLSRPSSGTRPSEESYAVARQLAVVIGDEAPIIELYLEALAAAPARHLKILVRRGTAILFAPTIPDGLESQTAAVRRGRRLTAAERLHTRIHLSPESTTVGVFDPEIDALVFPTSYTIEDLERLVLHELGHALTMLAAEGRPELLRGLSPAIAEHVFSQHYGRDNSARSLRERVQEALAESYVFLCCDRESEISGPMLSELLFILHTVEDERELRFDFEPGSSRSRTRVAASRLIVPGHRGLGPFLAKRPAPGTELPERPLESKQSGDDEAQRRAA